MIYLGIGSNLGNKILNIDKAKYYLEVYGVKIIKCSHNYETFSWPDASKPKFVNVVLEIDTKFSLNKLLKISKLIEMKLGRKKGLKNSPRVCDIDIISYGRKILSGTINIPHKRMHKRNFVLIPLYELDKNWSHPITNESIGKLIFSLPINDITSIKQI